MMTPEDYDPRVVIGLGFGFIAVDLLTWAVWHPFGLSGLAPWCLFFGTLGWLGKGGGE